MPTQNPSGSDPSGVPAEPVVTGNNLARGTRFLIVGQVLAQVVRFGSNIVLARILTPSDFGIVAIAAVVVLAMNQFQDVGTGAAIIQQRELTPRLTNAVFQFNFVLGCILSAGMVLLAAPIADFLRNPDATNVLRAFGAVTLLASLGQIHHALLRRDLRFKDIALVSSVATLVTAVVSIGLAVAGLGLWAIVFGTIAGSAVDTSLVWYLDKWRPKWEASWPALRSIWRFSLHLFMANLVFMIFQEADKLIVGRWLGASSLGLYGMSQRIVTYPTTSVTGVIMEVAFPAFARRQDDDEALRAGYIRTSGVVALVSLPLLIGAAVVAGPAVHVLFNSSWYPMIPLIWILAPVGIAEILSTSWSGVILAKGRTDILFRWRVVGTVVQISGGIIGLHWGLIGLCIGFAIGALILMPIETVIICRVIGLPVRTYLRSLASLLLSTAAMAIAAIAVQLALLSVDSALVVLVAAVAAGGAAYLLMIWRLRPAALQDVKMLLPGRRPVVAPELVVDEGVVER
jgi:lipopolysaccharide exporter